MVSRKILRVISSVTMAIMLIAVAGPVLASPATTVSIGSASDIRPYHTVTVPIIIQTDEMLGAATIRLDYNPLVVKVNGASWGDLGDVTANVDNISGRVKMVAAYGLTPGKTGTVKFADVTLEAVGIPEAVSPLTLTVVDMFNFAVQPVTLDAISNGTFTVGGRLEGDVNNDTFINSGDVLLVARHIVGIIGLTGDDLLAADVNDNGTVNSADLLLIKQYLVETIDIFPGGYYIP
jgi:hypothetical protein